MLKEENECREKEYDTEQLSSVQNLNEDGEWTILDGELEEEEKIEKYDPSLDEEICCVELINNNKIYISYDQEWTIKDVTYV
jgi:hypothetical protein